MNTNNSPAYEEFEELKKELSEYDQIEKEKLSMRIKLRSAAGVGK